MTDPFSLAIGLTFVGCLLYVCFMVNNPKTKPKRKQKPQTPEPIKQESIKEKPILKMEDFEIA